MEDCRGFETSSFACSSLRLLSSLLECRRPLEAAAPGIRCALSKCSSPWQQRPGGHAEPSLSGARAFTVGRAPASWFFFGASRVTATKAGAAGIFSARRVRTSTCKGARMGGGFNIHKTTSAACSTCGCSCSAYIGRSRDGAARCYVCSEVDRDDVWTGTRDRASWHKQRVSFACLEQEAGGRRVACRESHSIRRWLPRTIRTFYWFHLLESFPVVASGVRS